MKTVLAPVDFSSITERVIDTAVALAVAHEARLVLLNVVSPPTLASPEFAESAAAANLSDDAVVERLGELRRRLLEAGVTAHAIHERGPAVERILEQAERLEANYIVMGSHGHGALYGLLVGSTTDGVVKHAACPVVVVPLNVETQRATTTVHEDVLV